MRTIILAVAMLVLVQCATVSRGPMQRIRVDSKPAGASVQLAGCGVASDQRAITPATVFVNRRATDCRLTVSHPDYDSRTFVLVREGIPASGQDSAALVDAMAESQSAGELILVALFGGTAWVIGRGVDALSGARYEQDRTRIIVDFTKPFLATIAGRYKLVAVNGQELPAVTWKLRNRDCEIHTLSGWLILEEDHNWNSVIAEEELCDGERERLPDRAEKGLFKIDGEKFVLDSKGFANSAVFRENRLELTVRGLGFRHGQTAVFTFQLAQ